MRIGPVEPTSPGMVCEPVSLRGDEAGEAISAPERNAEIAPLRSQ
jgi:hypothetical protein